MADVGPIPRISAPRYLLRINQAPRHARQPDGDLLALVMFVVDATKPFSSPATM